MNICLAASLVRHAATMAEGLSEWEGMAAPERGEWRDFFAAQFRPLSEHDPALADRLAERFVRRFLQQADLSERRYREALESLVLEVGTTPTGALLLRARLPFTGTTTIEWDGTGADAETTLDDVADTQARTLEGDREMAGPTGWEPEFD